MKNILLALAFLAHLCAAETQEITVENTELVELQHWKKSQPLDEQFNAVELTMSSAEGENVLFLGAYRSELNHFTEEVTAGKKAFFIDFFPEHFGINVDDLKDPTLVCGNLDNIDFLGAMADRFAGKFSFITPDLGVFYGLNLQANHFKALVKMLRPGGKFVFDCDSFRIANSVEECILMAQSLYDYKLTAFEKFKTFAVEETRIIKIKILTEDESYEIDTEKAEFTAINPETKTKINEIYENYLRAWVDHNGIGVEIELISDEPVRYISHGRFEKPQILFQIIMTKK